MSNTNNIVELNGKYYDAASGVQVPAHGVHPQHVSSLGHVEVVKRPAGNHAVRSMDGMRPARAAHPVTPHQPARSKTLMRHAVKQPAAAVPAKPVVKAQSPLTAHPHAVHPKPSVHQIHPARAQRAQTALRSDVVRRFAQQRPVQSVAAAKPAVAPAAAPAANIERPVINSHAKPAVKPGHLHAQHQAHKTAASTSTDIFSQALAAAASQNHEPHHAPVQHRKNRSSRRWLIIVGATGVVAAFGFLAFMNKPAITMQMANMKTGFSVSLPDYRPEGYSVADMNYAPGAFKVAFNGPQGEKFSIDQKKSNWDSDTLMDNFVATTDQSYQAYQANGRTVFIYGDNNATWVNGGVWYQMKSDGLSQDEMLKVASTM